MFLFNIEAYIDPGKLYYCFVRTEFWILFHNMLSYFIINLEARKNQSKK